MEQQAGVALLMLLLMVPHVTGLGGLGVVLV